MTIEHLISAWDGESVVLHPDRPTGAWILIAIHSTRLGPAVGGTRMKPYPSLPAAVDDVLRLAEGMTYKLAAAEAAWGGGKAVIHLPAGFDAAERPALLRRYGALVKQLGGLFLTGPDVGTGPADMDIIGETGSPYIFARTPAAGGAGSSGPPTALGVFGAIQATCEYLFGTPDLRGRRVLVQGTGGVGGPLIDRLCAAGAEVLFSEVDPARVQHWRDERGLAYVSPEAATTTPCDVFAPCALGGLLDAATIAGLRCRAVVGGANNQLATPEDAARLQARGILYAPDFVVNAGGAVAIMGLEVGGWTPEEAEANVRRIGPNLRRVFERAARDGVTTDTAARRLAEERLRG
jgi:leucine dehydrogenase